ncbi:MAG: hypothetical protein OCD01_16885 [Fibrobacterales bacterium]
MTKFNIHLLGLNRKLCLFVLAIIVLASTASAANQDDIPFTFIRVGDMDGFGFNEGSGHTSAAGSPLNVDGIGMLYGGDFLPDLNHGGTVQASQGDDFDNRDGSEHGDGKVEARGAIINNGTKGSQWTDHTMAWATRPEFVFDFKVKEGMIDPKAEIYFNMIFGDYDNHGATIEISNNNGPITTLTPTLQNQVGAGEENDGLIQTTYYVVNFSDVFYKKENGYHIGYFKAAFNNVSDPFLTFDFAELGAEPIDPDIILAPGPHEITASDHELVAGDTVSLSAVVTDVYYETYQTSKEDFKWTIIADEKEEGDLVIVNTKGKSSFTATQAHRTVPIRVVYTDPDNSKKKLKDTITVTVVPAEPYGLDIEPTKKRKSKVEYYNDISFNVTDVLEDSVYAFVRDEYGNFIESAKTAQWTSGNSTQVSIDNMIAPPHGILFTTGESGETYIRVDEKGLLGDSVLITIVGEIEEPDTTRKHVEIIDTTWVDTTITKSISTLELEIEHEKGVVGQMESAELTIIAGNFESPKVSITATLVLPKGSEIEIELERGETDGVFESTENIYDALLPYEGDRITLEVYYEDYYGDEIRSELEVLVYEKVPFEISSGRLTFGIVRSLLDYTQVSDKDLVENNVLFENSSLQRENHALFVESGKNEVEVYDYEDEEFSGSIQKEESEFIGPTINLELEVPKISGDLEGTDFDFDDLGKPAWNATVILEVFYYNTQGEYIRAVSQEITLGKEYLESGTAKVYQEWIPEHMDDYAILTAHNNRHIQSGVILAAIKSTIVYSLAENYADIDNGYTATVTKSALHSFGYIRHK